VSASSCASGRPIATAVATVHGVSSVWYSVHSPQLPRRWPPSWRAPDRGAPVRSARPRHRTEPRACVRAAPAQRTAIPARATVDRSVESTIRHVVQAESAARSGRRLAAPRWPARWPGDAGAAACAPPTSRWSPAGRLWWPPGPCATPRPSTSRTLPPWWSWCCWSRGYDEQGARVAVIEVAWWLAGRSVGAVGGRKLVLAGESEAGSNSKETLWMKAWYCSIVTFCRLSCVPLARLHQRLWHCIALMCSAGTDKRGIMNRMR